MEPPRQNLTLEQYAAITRALDHSVLSQNATRVQVKQAAEFANDNFLASVCVRPCDVHYASTVLRLHSNFKPNTVVCSVVNFPHGNSSEQAVLKELDYAQYCGAQEFDVVAPFSYVFNNQWVKVEMFVRDVSIKVQNYSLNTNKKHVSKIIFETGLLNEAQIIKLCDICDRAKIDFIKTSTGFLYKNGALGIKQSGADVMSVATMLKHRGQCDVKASGGVKTLKDVIKYLKMGVSRVGTSNSEDILNEAKKFIKV